MKKIISTLFLITLFSAKIFCQQGTTIASQLTEAEKDGIIKKTNHLKLPWIENKGRQDGNVAYYTAIANGNVYVTKLGQIVYHTIYSSDPMDIYGKTVPTNRAFKKEDKINIRGNVWREDFINASINAMNPEYTAPSTVSYFVGNDPSKWGAGRPTYYTVSLGEVWKNIEVKLNKNGNSIEKRFYVYPGGSVADIAMQLTGSEGLSIDGDGSLITGDKAVTKGEQMHFSPPIAYQYIDDKKVPVAVHYILSGNIYHFTVGAYNPQYTLIIDPVLSLSTLSASTYIGGSYYDYSNSITTDANGNVYIASATLCTNYPVTTGAYQTSNAGNLSAYVSEFNSDLSSLLASTYIGGGNSNNQAMFVTVASSGDVYVTGQTLATDYPTTSGAYQTAYGGGDFDDFIAKFNPGLTSLLASTYLGGSGDDLAYSIAFDNTDNLYLGGFTTSSNYPATAGVYSGTLKGSSNAFITKMDPNLATVMISTFIGGSGNDYGYSIARDATGNLYISGQTTSTDYPTAGSPYQASLNGASDTYVSKMNSSLTTLLASTYFGGSGGEQTNTLVLDKNKNVYLTGWENSSDFPTTSGAYQSTYGGGQNDAYISCLDSSLSTLLASTYLGGNTDDYGYGLSVDAATGTIYVSGFTGGGSASSTYPTTAGCFQSTYGGGYYDAFVSVLNNSVTTLQQSTFLGGSGSDFGYTLAVSPTGNLYVTGQTQSDNFPTTGGSYQPANAGAADVFVSKFGNFTSLLPVAQFTASGTTICAGDTVSFTDQSTGSPTSWNWTFARGIPATSTSQNPTIVYTTPGTYSVKLVVGNSSGSDSLTQTSYITVSPSPVPGVIIGPGPQCAGDTVILSDTGSAGNLQWQSSPDGILFSNISGDTSSSLNIAGVSQTAYYRVTAGNACGTDSSAMFELVVNHSPVPVVSTPDSLICYGDSTHVCTADTFATYLWNTGTTSYCTTAGEGGGYWVSVTDANHCSAISSHQEISVYPVPSISIIVQGDTLSSYGQVSYQWILNDSAVNGATGPAYIASQSGSYTIQITDTNGCKAISNPVALTGVTDLAEENISLYPNPSTSGWQLAVSSELIGSSLEIYDDNGRIVFQSEIRNPRSEISLNVAKGVYWLRISNDGTSVVRKVVRL